MSPGSVIRVPMLREATRMSHEIIDAAWQVVQIRNLGER